MASSQLLFCSQSTLQDVRSFELHARNFNVHYTHGGGFYHSCNTIKGALSRRRWREGMQLRRRHSADRY